MKSLNALIKNIIEGENRSHAYIIEGREGANRDKFLSELILGLGSTELDTVYMQKTGRNGYRSEDSVSFAERLCMRPYGRYLTGIITEAETLSEIAQNKLLKTLEEPLENVIILLLTSRSDELLRTVRSRCSLIRISEYEGFESGDEAEIPDELREGAAIMFSPERTFYQFREFAEKSIKTPEDAIKYICLIEENLRSLMAPGSDAGECAAGIEAAERTAMDINRGMDKNKALKKLFLTFEGKPYKV